jgi:ribosome-associated protein
MNQHQDDEDLVDLPPSKTKIKKQMLELQNIGEQLADLNKDQLKELELPENLRDAINEVKKMTKFGAINRQMQYIGRLMRDVDTAPIIAKLEVWKGTSKQHITWLHACANTQCAQGKRTVEAPEELPRTFSSTQRDRSRSAIGGIQNARYSSPY